MPRLYDHMAGMAVRAEIAKPVSAFPIAIKASESLVMMDVKRAAERRLGNVAAAAFVAVSGARAPGLAFPVRAVVWSMSATPGRVIRLTPIIRFPGAKAFAIAKMLSLVTFWPQLPMRYLFYPATVGAGYRDERPRRSLPAPTSTMLSGADARAKYILLTRAVGLEADGLTAFRAGARYLSILSGRVMGGASYAATGHRAKAAELSRLTC